MDMLAYAGLGLFCLSSLWVGGHLALLWRRTQKGPEGLAAVALLGVGPLGFVPAVASGHLAAVSAQAGAALWALAASALTLGTYAAFRFTQTVFFPSSARVRGIVEAMGLLLLILWVGESLATGFVADIPASGFTRASDWVRTGALLWGGWTSLTHFRAARRREALGLAESGVAARFLLWGIALSLVGLAGVLDSSAKLVVVSRATADTLLLVNAAAGSGAAVALYLTFLRRPPAVQQPASV